MRHAAMLPFVPLLAAEGTLTILVLDLQCFGGWVLRLCHWGSLVPDRKTTGFPRMVSCCVFISHRVENLQSLPRKHCNLCCEVGIQLPLCECYCSNV